ncbi:MAG: PEP-utilizing enzyme [Candidatus Woesearchaeota archaeon]
MTEEQLSPKNYNNLFRMTGKLTCLHSEFFLKGSLSLGEPVIIFKDGVWHSFIHKEHEQKCLEAGLKLFSNKSKYQNYAESFREYIKEAKENIIPKYKEIPQELTKEEFAKVANFMSIFWYYYGFTEFSYHDLAYEKMIETGDKVLKENLDDLGQLKFAGREIMNAYLFNDGVAKNILKSLSKKFLYNEDDAEVLYPEELLMLFDGFKPSKELIEQRKKCFALARINDNIINYSYEEALELARKFTTLHESGDLLEGIIANKGIAKGKVIIAPMLNDQVEINKIIAKMRKGDILVAQSTTPDIMCLCNKAAAIVSDQGGMLSHAAIVSRELNIPCIIGTQNGTLLFKDGDEVEVDANEGIVRKII